MKNRLYVSLSLCALPVIPILYYFSDLPSKMAVHIENGTPDIFMNKYVATFGIVLFCMFIQIIDYQFKYKIVAGQNALLDMVHLLGIPLITNLLMGNILYFALKEELLNYKTFGGQAVVGIVLILMGMLIITTKMNFMFPNQWRKNKKELPRQTILFATGLYICSGAFLLFFHPTMYIQLGVLLMVVLLPRLFSKLV